MSPAARRKIRNFIVELIIYTVMVAIYLYLVVTYLSGWFLQLYDNDLALYAVVALLFIVVQSVLLDSLTSFIMDKLGLERL